LKLYGELASWWPLLSPPEDYVEEAGFYSLQLRPSQSERLTLLELGSGGGNNAFHMKKSFDITLVDLSPAMVGISRRLNPDCEHLTGDMRSVRIGREFDRVFIHDAIVYMTTIDDLRLAIETAYSHCRSGGWALFAPDHVRETFRPSTDHGGEDGEGRSLRYLEWTWDPDPSDSTYVVDYAYILRDETAAATIVEHDRHEEGLFSRPEWLTVLTEAGFEAESVPFDHSELEPGSYEVFVARKP
jgi:SAM-dependent methyltransferase